MKKALITGITGQDGSYLADLLLSKNYEVHGFRRKNSQENTFNINHLIESEKIYNKNFFLHYGDITDTSSITSLIYHNKFDEIYHLSSQSHVHTSFQVPEYTTYVNVMGSIKILEATNKFLPNCRFYNASTSELYGKAVENIQNEKTPFNPRSPYAIAKLHSHLITQNYKEAYNIFACNGILFNHESPRRGKTFVTRKISESVSKIKLCLQDFLTIGNLDSKRDWGYAKEYVEAMWLMLQQDSPEDFVIGTGKSYSVRYFIEKSFKEVEIDIVWSGKGVNEIGLNKKNNKIVVKIDKFFFRPTEVEFLHSDPSNAQEKLKWKYKMELDELISLMVSNDYNYHKKYSL
jgi:GDPmannose 4,6-dehydratase